MALDRHTTIHFSSSKAVMQKKDPRPKKILAYFTEIKQFDFLCTNQNTRKKTHRTKEKILTTLTTSILHLQKTQKINST